MVRKSTSAPPGSMQMFSNQWSGRAIATSRPAGCRAPAYAGRAQKHRLQTALPSDLCAATYHSFSSAHFPVRAAGLPDRQTRHRHTIFPALGKAAGPAPARERLIVGRSRPPGSCLVTQAKPIRVAMSTGQDTSLARILLGTGQGALTLHILWTATGQMSRVAVGWSGPPVGQAGISYRWRLGWRSSPGAPLTYRRLTSVGMSMRRGSRPGERWNIASSAARRTGSVSTCPWVRSRSR